MLMLSAAQAGAASYDVGPGQALTSIGAVPWATLQPGDVVRIHHRADPYREKWVLNRSGTEAQPIRVQGVPAADGSLPVISGENASTVPGVNFWGDERGLIKIGGANTPSGSEPPAWIIIEDLKLQGAYKDYSFTDDGGATKVYSNNAAGVYIEYGANVTIRRCEITDNGNGIFCAGDTSELLIEDCYIHGNGVVDRFYEHNTYTEATGITYRGNRFGPLRSGALGNNLKDRSAGLLVEYNWIEGGNRTLDLVDSHDQGRINSGLYYDTWVIGNVLIELDDGLNSQVIHYGGDSGTTADYRKGTLHLYHNTIYSWRSGNTTLVRLSTGDESCDARNNIVHAANGGSKLALLESFGTISLTNNWITQGYVNSHDGGASITVTGAATTVSGADPGLAAPVQDDYGLTPVSANRDAAIGIPGTQLLLEYLPHQQTGRRYDDGQPDRGALEYHSSVYRTIRTEVTTADVNLSLLEPVAAASDGDAAAGWTIHELFSDEDAVWTWQPAGSS